MNVFKNCHVTCVQQQQQLRTVALLAENVVIMVHNILVT